jgi:hypothetical protein
MRRRKPRSHVGELEHRRQRLPGEPDVHVWVVLEDREPVLARQGEQPVALLAREREAGRVLEVGDDVREGGLDAAREQRAQGLRVDAVGLELDRVQLGPAVAEVEQRAVIGRALDDDLVARRDEGLEQERVRLHRAVRDQHPLGLHAVALRDPLAQRRVADRGAVGRDAAGVVVERALRGLAEAPDVDDVQ